MAKALKGASVKVAGLDDMRKALQKLDEKGLLAQLKDANYSVAALVVRTARAKAAGLGAQESRAADSLKASKSAVSARVVGGSNQVPFFGGAEFGAAQGQIRNTTRGLMHGWNQFHGWTGSTTSAGRFLYPAIRADADEIADLYLKAIDELTAAAFPD